MAKIYYSRVDEFWRKGEKYAYLEEKEHVGNVEWQELQPDAKHTWITEGLRTDFDIFIPIATKEAKQLKSDAEVIFKTFSLGVNTARDSVVYDFAKYSLLEEVAQFCDEYNAEVMRYQQKGKPKNIDDFLKYEKVKWSEHLKTELKRGELAIFDATKIKDALYRPFTRKFLYYDSVLNDRPGLFKRIFPSHTSKSENRLICLTTLGSEKPFAALLSNNVPDLHLTSPGTGAQCFPLYLYNEDGTNRRENITDWALGKFREQYGDSSITKWDIFHYVYALLHHAVYRERYAANLKRELPRIPFAPDFRAFAGAGAQLAEIHVHYEEQPEYALERQEQSGVALNWRVEKMKLGKDRRSLRYNEFLTLDGIPEEAFEYRLGNRSALEWVIDQYQVTTDKRSGITNDPNRPDDPSYILRLVGQVITVSLETVRIVRSLPVLGIDELR